MIAFDVYLFTLHYKVQARAGFHKHFLPARRRRTTF
jgi:hypothetical protein